MSNFYDEYEPYYSIEAKPKCGLRHIVFNSETKEIINKGDVYALGVVMKRKYVEGFIKRGTLKFGTPKAWIDYAMSKGPGKGDMQEGVFAAYNIEDESEIKEALKQNPNAYSIRLVSSKSDLVYLVDKTTIELPTYCFYIIRTGDFRIVKHGGSENTAHLYIPHRYFRGLSEWKSWEQSTKDPKEEQNIFVIICDPNAFINLLYKRLIELGIPLKSIICRPIDYKNRDIPFSKEADHPLELFFKNKQFDDQHEGRIVVNITDQKTLSILKNCPISIGSLEDICIVHDQYPAGGINLIIDLDNK